MYAFMYAYNIHYDINAISSHVKLAQGILSVTIQDPMIWNENNKVT